jgi:predicted amino acid-binding ACT domain protein
MSFRARLRVELPDRPGALAKVAAVIAEHGGNLIGIDVQEVEQDIAIDELVVDVPDGVDLDGLRQALVESGAGVLVSHQAGAQRTDPVLRSLRWACAMVAAGPHAADDELARAVAEVTGTGSAWVCTIPEARRFEAGRLALVRGAPVSHRTADVPPSRAPGLVGDVWLLAVPDARLDPQRVAFAARPPAERFTATEVARIEALLGLRRQLDIPSFAALSIA